MTNGNHQAGRRRSGFANVILLGSSILVATVLAEAATRLIDGLPLFADYLPSTVDRDAPIKHLDEMKRAKGVERRWFVQDPPPLPNRKEVPEEWIRLARAINEAPSWVVNAVFRTADQFKAWNSVFAAEPCNHPLLRQAPGRLFVHDSPEASEYPRFRFLPDATTPLGLVTNGLGWRGPPVEFQKSADTVRIVFVGASTTVNSHFYPYSYPEFIGNWLNLWAASQRLSVRFEALNAGRESVISTDIEAIVRREVLPLQPDLVIYYEGANQFDLRALLASQPTLSGLKPGEIDEGSMADWLRYASTKSALARRLQYALGMLLHESTGAERIKPAYSFKNPNEFAAAPDIRRTDLPLGLSTILADLERMRANLARSGADFALSSYVWLAHDGLVLDPVQHKTILDHLNVSLFPLQYRDIERASAFQNQAYEKFAATNNLLFVDVARQMPRIPDLFTDGVHMTYGGVRLHAWIVLQGLIPYIEKKLASGEWPRPHQAPAPPPPGLYYVPREVLLACASRN